MGINDPGNIPQINACTINTQDVFNSLNSPITQSDFLTPGYVEPDDMEPTEWSLRIYYSLTEYRQFTWFIKPESVGGVGEYGQRGSFHFIIDDSVKQEGTQLPFQLTEELYAVLMNFEESYTYAAGYIQKCPKKVVTGLERDDGTEAGEFHVVCTDLYHELERKTVDKQYTNRRLGYIVKDVIQRYTTLDASLIDPLMGFEVANKRFTSQTPAQVLQWALDLMDWTFLIEPDTRRLRLLDKTDIAARVPIEINDQNVYDYFDVDTFELGRDSTNLKNMIEFHYNAKFFLGPVNTVNSPAALSDRVVASVGNTVDWTSIPQGVEFYIDGLNSLYTVERNLTSMPTKELRLSSQFKEGTLAGAAGYIRGWRKRLFVTDELSIAFMKQVRGGDGIVKYLLSEDNNNFTPDEARQFAAAQLVLANPLPVGKANSTNDGFPFAIRPGHVIYFNLTKRKKFKGDVTIQSYSWQWLGGYIEPDESFDGYYHPKLAIEIGFTPVFVGEVAQARKTSQDLKRVYVNDLQDITEDYVRLNEMIAVKDCVHWRSPAHTGLYKTGSAYSTDLHHYSFSSTG